MAAMNWQIIISDLINSGLTQVEIAQRAQIAQPTVSSLLRGSQVNCNWTIGNRLLEIHRRSTGRSYEHALRK